MSHTPLILCITAGVILTIGDIVLKQWVVSNYRIYFYLGIFIYLISMFFLAYSYKYEDIAVASLLMTVFNVVILTFVGKFVFYENITIYEMIGITLGIFSVIMLQLGKP